MKLNHRLGILALAVGLVLIGSVAQAQQKKPNIVVIFGDDVGIWNISAYHRGMMGGRTPNIGGLENHFPAREMREFLTHSRLRSEATASHRRKQR